MTRQRDRKTETGTEERSMAREQEGRRREGDIGAGK